MNDSQRGSIFGSHFLLFEFLAASAVTGAFAWWSQRDTHNTLEMILAPNRATIYGTLASMLGTLLGFAVTAVSILLGLWPHDNLKLVRGSGHSTTLWRIFTSCTRWLAIATGVTFSALLFDTTGAPKVWLVYLCAWTLAVSAVRLVRVIWVLEQVMSIVTRPDASRDGTWP